jgi:ribonucleotide monophosphatase NagD (HAD superfamily)
LPFEQTAEMEAADFILNTGVEDSAVRAEDFEAALQTGARRALPMVCAKVHYFGKPHAPIYQESLVLLGIADRRRILAVGDSLRTDIAGANGAGIDALLVLSGIHSDELAAGDLEAVCRRERALPIAAVTGFRW